MVNTIFFTLVRSTILLYVATLYCMQSFLYTIVHTCSKIFEEEIFLQIATIQNFKGEGNLQL